MSFFGGNLVECRACHEEISEEAEVCPNCGEPQSGFKLFGGDLEDCRACGAKISTEAESCPHCSESTEGFKMFGGDLEECRACGKKISTDAESCPHCGESTEGFKMFGGDLEECRACGEKISTEAERCPHCGEPTEGFKMFGGDLEECRTCGRKISTETDECPHCGEIFVKDAGEEEINKSSSRSVDRESPFISTENYSEASYGSGYSGNTSHSDYSAPSDYSSKTDSGSSSRRNPIVAVIVLVVLGIVGWSIYKAQNRRETRANTYTNYQTTPAQTAPVNYNSTPTQPPQPVSTNPYGEGNGCASFYHTNIMEESVQIYFEGDSVGLVNEIAWSDPECGGQGTFSFHVPTGKKLFIFKDEHDLMWKEYVDVPLSGCTLIKVSVPEHFDKNYDGIMDFFTTYNNDSEDNPNHGSNGYISCPQCEGKKIMELYGNCPVCTYYGAGHMAISGYVKCPDCGGRGTVNDQSCPRCKQTGQVECSNCHGEGRSVIPTKCNLCSGKGRIGK